MGAPSAVDAGVEFVDSAPQDGHRADPAIDNFAPEEITKRAARAARFGASESAPQKEPVAQAAQAVQGAKGKRRRGGRGGEQPTRMQVDLDEPVLGDVDMTEEGPAGGGGGKMGTSARRTRRRMLLQASAQGLQYGADDAQVEEAEGLQGEGHVEGDMPPPRQQKAFDPMAGRMGTGAHEGMKSSTVSVLRRIVRVKRKPAPVQPVQQGMHPAFIPDGRAILSYGDL
mmetsp:Transcript_10137/g.17653  ORF Transcript_10137/g.17653 Transcript_10137/m.17653 type:complete len:227 (+) Transcript_10137:80-760(+)